MNEQPKVRVRYASPRPRRRVIFASIVALILTLAAPATRGAVRITVSRNPALNMSGARVLGRGMLMGWGGVVLQGQAKFVDGKGEHIASSEIVLGEYDRVHSRLCFEHRPYMVSGLLSWVSTTILRRPADCYWYPIPEDDLGRIVSWIENLGTGLYTAFELDAAAQREAGVSPSHHDAFVATEFAGSELEDVADYLDFPDPDLVASAGDLNAIIAARSETLAQIADAGASQKGVTPPDPSSVPWGNDLAEGSYIVSDLDSQFVATLEAAEVSTSGTLHRYTWDWTGVDDEVEIVKVERYVEGSPAKLERYLVDRDEYGVLNREERAEAAANHHRALRFAQSIALLRAVRRGSPSSWARFQKRLFTAD